MQKQLKYLDIHVAFEYSFETDNEKSAKL